MKQQIKTGVGAKCALFGAALIWGSSFFIMKNATDVLPTNFLLAIRYTVGCILLCIIFHKRLKKINKQYIISGAIIGVLLIMAYIFQTIGLKGTTPGKNAFLTDIYCIVVPFIFWAVNKTKPDKYNISSAILCLAGIACVSLTGDLTIGIGDALTIVGGLLFAVHIVAIAKLVKDKDPIMITMLQFAMAAIIAWILCFTTETIPHVSVWDYSVVFEMIYLSVFATTIALLLQNVGQKYSNPSSASIILSLESVLGVAFSVIFYGERLSVRLVIGFVLIFVAIIVSETKLSFLNRKKY